MTRLFSEKLNNVEKSLDKINEVSERAQRECAQLEKRLKALELANEKIIKQITEIINVINSSN